eukprot:CAMPEP_0169446038 /NCGR_PEP_ID=MMETSP1042-20121227/10761_1 /TAXON_ID=464988 /ORGANISM="Hemiselmis andersenii, Strain CCMP1180" /LENGTH=193 /DNA_ID=CAMNT_0009557477 /DNA_START=143 /DNA_END=727 /DNA_ORIENTATION=-
MAKHQPDVMMCRNQPGISVGRVCAKHDGACVIAILSFDEILSNSVGDATPILSVVEGLSGSPHAQQGDASGRDALKAGRREDMVGPCSACALGACPSGMPAPSGRARRSGSVTRAAAARTRGGASCAARRGLLRPSTAESDGAGEGQGWLPQDNQPWQRQEGLVLSAQEVCFQQAVERFSQEMQGWGAVGVSE